MSSLEDRGRGARGAPEVEADYIPPPSVSVRAFPDRARPSSGTRTLLLYILIAPIVGGLAAGAVVWQRNRSAGDFGHLEININPPDAVIQVDGKQMADRSPASIPLHPGVYNVSVRRAGFVGIEQKVDVNSGQIVAMSVALVVDPTPVPARPRRPKPRLPAKLDGVVYVDMGGGSAAEPPPAAAASK